MFYRGKGRETQGVCSTGGTDVKRRRLGRLRRDDQVPVRLLALGLRLHVAAVAEVLVDDATLRRRHGVERDGAPGGDRVVRSLVGLTLEDCLGALAVAGGVDDDAAADVRAVLLADHALSEVLHGLDGLAVAADEEPEVV